MCPDAWFSWTHLGPTIVFYSIIYTNKSDGRSARTRTMNFGPKRSFYSKFWMLWPDIWSIIWTRQQCSPCSLCPSTSTTTSNCHTAARSDRGHRANARVLLCSYIYPPPPCPPPAVPLPTAKKQSFDRFISDNYGLANKNSSWSRKTLLEQSSTNLDQGLVTHRPENGVKPWNQHRYLPHNLPEVTGNGHFEYLYIADW